MNNIRLRDQATKGFIFLCAITIAGTFILQVKFNSPLPALIPYVFLLGSFALQIQHLKKIERNKKSFFSADNLIQIYLLLNITHLLYYFTYAEDINWKGLLSNIVNFIFPVTFYYFFRFAGLSYFKFLLWGVILSCFILGTLTFTDSYKKLKISESHFAQQSSHYNNEFNASNCISSDKENNLVEKFQRNAAKYSMMRSNAEESELCASMRFSEVRSSGFMENHAVFAIWIGMAIFLTLAVIPQKFFLMRNLLLICFGIFLVTFQYYTAIFITLIILMYVYFVQIKKRDKNFLQLFFLICLLFYLYIISGFPYLMWERVEIILNGKYLISIMNKINDLVAWWENFPIGFFIGDGLGIYYSYSFTKGGDIGFIETIAKLGIPIIILFAYILYSFFRIWCEEIKLSKNYHNETFIYIFSVLILFILSDIHYSVWSSKAILPFLFSCIAFLDLLLKKTKTINTI